MARLKRGNKLYFEEVGYGYIDRKYKHITYGGRNKYH